MFLGNRSLGNDEFQIGTKLCFKIAPVWGDQCSCRDDAVHASTGVHYVAPVLNLVLISDDLRQLQLPDLLWNRTKSQTEIARP